MPTDRINRSIASIHDDFFCCEATSAVHALVASDPVSFHIILSAVDTFAVVALALWANHNASASRQVSMILGPIRENQSTIVSFKAQASVFPLHSASPHSNKYACRIS